jgi:serine/threonine protein phosphatase 1
MNTYNPVKHFDANTVGRDFVCSDLHGCIDDLLEAMAVLNFDTSCDRMFSVGDLVDRGPKSFETAELIYKDWFHPVRGNHEQMFIDAILHGNNHQLATWIRNGGEWFTNFEEWQVNSLAEDVAKLPIVITVGDGESRFNIVHAELTKRITVEDYRYAYVPVTNEDIDGWTFGIDDEFSLLWGRTMVRDRNIYQPLDVTKRFHSEELSITYVGHSVLADVVQIEKQVYLDLGAVFSYVEPITPSSSITIAEPKVGVLYKFSTATKEMQTITLAGVEKFHQ